MMFTNNSASCALSCAILSALLLAAEGRATAGENSPSSLISTDLAGTEIQNPAKAGTGTAQIEPVLVVANISEASKEATEPIKVLVKAEILNQGDLQKSPLVSVVPPASATEPVALVAKVPPAEPLEIHANVPLNAPIKFVTEVAPDVPEVTIVVHRGMRRYSPWKTASSTTRGMFNVNFK